MEEVASECYTVDLFTTVEIEQPSADVPAANQAFLGEWAGGAWNDVWCHGLLVNKVYRDGRVELVDMHAPYSPWAQPATAFRRVGRIDETGVLRFAHGTSRLSYRIENGKLIGTNSGQYGNLSVELARRDGAPTLVRLSEIPTPNAVSHSEMPMPKPLRLSQTALAAKSGS
ncbi:MAG TPA: hypothetical protein VMY41_08755 [Thermohalobaculum sp.]|nr:hypothetical protein [Thermohalobaculum sp.]